MTSFDDGMKQAAETDQAVRFEEKLADCRRDRDSKGRALQAARSEAEDLQRLLGLRQSFEALDPSPPSWLAPERDRSVHHATPFTILSDTHFDEVVRPEEVGGYNAYNRDIASVRLRRYFNKVIELSRDYFAGVSYDGLVLALGGDLVTGEIHEELTNTNEDTILGTVLYWTELLAAGVHMLADEFGKVHVVSVPGNHGRRTRKPRKKLQARDNFDWFLSHAAAREFKYDERVTFQIPESNDALVSVYDTKFHLEHGHDGFRGGNGIAGLWSPIKRGELRAKMRDEKIGKPFDHLVLGHFHNLIFGPSFTINGSLKGYDEYAYDEKFEPERPQQALFLVTPERGVTGRYPIHCDHRASEGW